MAEHELLYFPYASLTDAQLPLLKVAALYFDKLAILDPAGASWNTIGADDVARGALKELTDAGLLEVVRPADVLQRFSAPMLDAIRRDLSDPEFVKLCEGHAARTGKQRWTLALAKVPQELQTDQTMRHLMGDFARGVATDSGRYVERAGMNPAAYLEFAATGQSYDEYRHGPNGGLEYRYADFPLALGEAIMMNHALFAGLLHAGATPITDDPFHSRMLSHKLRRAAQDPAIRDVLEDRITKRRIKAGALAGSALTDTEVKLPILAPSVPLSEVLEHRRSNAAALARVRETLGLIARRIESEPWSDDFEAELETRTLPDLQEALAEVTQARDKWLESQRGRRWLKAAGVAVGAATAALGLVAAPLTPVALASAGLGLASGVAIPGAEWLLDWQAGKNALHENGLHYLLGV